MFDKAIKKASRVWHRNLEKALKTGALLLTATAASSQLDVTGQFLVAATAVAVCIAAECRAGHRGDSLSQVSKRVVSDVLRLALYAFAGKAFEAMCAGDVIACALAGATALTLGALEWSIAEMNTPVSLGGVITLSWGNITAEAIFEQAIRYVATGNAKAYITFVLIVVGFLGLLALRRLRAFKALPSMVAGEFASTAISILCVMWLTSLRFGEWRAVASMTVAMAVIWPVSVLLKHMANHGARNLEIAG